MLISNGADVNQPDTEEKRPLHYARAQGIPEIIELLARNGAY